MLELKHVGFETDDNKEILHDVSLTVQDRFVAITGPNGGGKSTLAKVIAGIYQPTSGQILLDGVDITHMTITERANLGISYAFQQPVRFKGLRVHDLLSLAAGKDTSVAQACAPTSLRYAQACATLVSFPAARLSRSCTRRPLNRTGCWKA